MSGSLDYRRFPTEELVSAWRELGGLVRAMEAERLKILAVLAERDAHRVDGCVDAAQWVAANDMVPAAEARAVAATAERLEELPATSQAAREGRLSMAQLVPLAELADADTDAAWAERGPACTPAALAQLAKQRRLVQREQAERQQRRKHVRWWKDRHGLGVRFAGLLPDDEAAVVTGSLERRAEQMPRHDDGSFTPFEQRCADALVEQASEDLGAAGTPELVVHVPVGVEKLAPTLADGTPVAIEVIRRLACDATVRLLVENPDGTVAGYGRRRRIVPEKLRSRLRQRDRNGCRWHGCDHRRGLKAHHMDEWIADHGATEEANCILLCPTHHRLCHEGGWKVTGDPNVPGGLTFHRPGWGRTLPAAPTPADEQLRSRYGLGEAAA